MATKNARSFWERKVAEEAARYTGNCVDVAGHPYCTVSTSLGRYQDSKNVWSNIYCTIRDRRRSRSRTSTSSISRSRTPSSVSSGRTTPSPGPQLQSSGRAMSEELLVTSPETPSRQSSLSLGRSKYQMACWLEPRSVPVHYSSTVIIQLDSKKKSYYEEITFQKRLVPRQFSESMEVATDQLCRSYTSEVTIPCQPPLFISLEPQQELPDNDTPALTTVL